MSIPTKTVLKIIAYILLIISKEIPKGQAVAMASAKFGISEDEIWSMGGF